MFSQTWKSVEEVDKNLMEMLNAQNYNVTDYFKSTDSAVPKTPTNPDDEKKKRDTEIYYFEVCLLFDVCPQNYMHNFGSQSNTSHQFTVSKMLSALLIGQKVG